MLTNAFDELAFSLLGGNNVDISDNGGFSLRNSIGSRINRTLSDGDTVGLDELLDKNAAYPVQDPTAYAQLQAVVMGMRMNAMQEGTSLTSSYQPALSPVDSKLVNG